MKLTINRNSPIPLVEQIHNGIADRILSGYFAKGARLPSVRQLSKQLQVSPVTVVHALELLEAEKLINRIQGKGTFVYDAPENAGLDTNAPEEGGRHKGKSRQNIHSQGSGPVPLDMPDYLHRSQYLYYNQKPAEINFSLSAVAPQLLPTEELAKSLLSLAQQQPEILAHYGEIQGDLQLRQALSNYFAREKIQAGPQEILVTNGSQQGIDLVARTFIGPGDLVITEEPTYAAAIDVFRSRGATIVSIPMDEEGMRIDKLYEWVDRQTPKLIYTIPSFQSPTGKVMSARRRRQLLELANDVNCYILEDDPWSEIYYEEAPPPHIKSLDADGRVIYLKGLSKMLSPGCRIGFMIASVPLLNRLITAKTNADLGNPLLNQKVILPIFESEHIHKLLARLRPALRSRRDLCLSLLGEHAPPGLVWNRPKGGFNLWLSLPEGANTNDLLMESERQGITFLPGSSCFPNHLAWHHLRICFAHVDEPLLRQGIIKLLELIKQYLEDHHRNKGRTPVF
ncbi:MocR-like pyridoxine biosynthesis transcription factor PdxR [Paenibacillus senegalensis]|uniref:MocR-like pyridoxine biosynthesis transcription factor PdxR n=1 Tax=Paenibacillus senegalensis TaxID=1465766 RepID=UPI00028820DC|nr:PLP-dependent aminotransferase family protein [Paenibacillus senegalensis]